MIQELDIKNYDDLIDLFDAVEKVHAELFPDATIETQCAKFSEEYNEMQEAAEQRDEIQIKNEAADCFIVAAGIHRFNHAVGYILFKVLCDGIPDNYEFAEAIINKMNKNIKRKWDNKNGYYKHTTLN